MKCLYCSNELGQGDVCLNHNCSYFNTKINVSNNSDLEHNINHSSDKLNIKNNPQTNSSNYNSDRVHSEMKSSSSDGRTSIHNITLSNGSNAISKEELAIFIGSNSKYYFKDINKFENKNKFLSWNWSCFLLSSYWLLYRKLYIPAIILIGIDLVSAKLLEKKVYWIVTMLAIRIMLAIFANSIYLSNCVSKIKNIKTTIINLNAGEYKKNLRKKGGVTLALPIILLILSILSALIYIVIWFADASSAPNYLGSYYL